MVLWVEKIWGEMFFFAICSLLIVGRLFLLRSLFLSIGRGSNSSFTVEKVVGGNAVVGRSS